MSVAARPFVIPVFDRNKIVAATDPLTCLASPSPMNGQENTPTSTLLCANGCGFYGSPTTKNLCSKCYGESLHLENQQQDQQIKQHQAEAVIRAAAAAVSSKSSDPNNVMMSADSSKIGSGDVEMSVQSLPSIGSTNITSINEPLPPLLTTRSPPTGDIIAEPTVLPSHSAPGSESASSAEDPDRLKNKGRCFKCNKKVGLLGFQCRCGDTFCGTHRHGDMHSCQFDYRELARQQLSKANQKVVAEKLNRI